MTTLTTANSAFTLECPAVFSIPQLIQGYATEDAFSVPQYELGRAVMGVDARMSGAFVPSTKELDIVLQADSRSNRVFQQIIGVIEAQQETVFMNATIVMPGQNEVWQFTRGILTKVPALAAAKKTAEARTYQITWESIKPAGI
jgi:hypothetical protein